MAETWLRVSREAPANPASLHRPGQRARAILEDARERVAELLRCEAREVIFTSGATESNNLALFGLARGLRDLHGAPPLLLSSAAEHPSVLGPLRSLQQQGFPLKLVPVDPHAKASIPDMQEALAEHPRAIVALQWANHETGVVQNPSSLLEALPEDAHLHCDAAQGWGRLPFDPSLEGAHSVVLSGHKFGAPKGIGVLRLRSDCFLEPLLVGGDQQRALRPGTESPALAAAFALALELAAAERKVYAERTWAAGEALLSELRAGFRRAGLSFEDRVVLNCPRIPGQVLPNTLNLSFRGVDGRLLLPACDAEGLALASGSACASGAPEPSPVLRACGHPEALARASLRISFGGEQTASEGREAGRRLTALILRAYKLANH